MKRLDGTNKAALDSRLARREAVEAQPVAAVGQAAHTRQNRRRGTQPGAAGDQEHDQDLVLHRFDRLGAGEDLAGHHAGKRHQPGRRHGVDDGHEGGAHISWQPVHSMVLIPGVAESSSLPVIGAGGICDCRTMAAAMALGAVGIQMGTRFIATQECDFWDVWKEGVLKSSDRDTLVARGMFGPMRFIQNESSIRLVDKTTELSPAFFKGQPVDLNQQLVEIEREGFARLVENDTEGSLILGGEAAGRIDDLPTVKTLIERIARNAERIVSELPGEVIG